MIFTEDQTKLLTMVSERLEAFPETHNQQYWYRHDGLKIGTIELILFRGGPVSPLEMRECGTVACVAGHTVFAALDLGMDVDEEGDVAPEAERLLGLVDGASDSLFASSADEADVRAWVAEAATTGELPTWSV